MEKKSKQLRLKQLYNEYEKEFAGEELVFGDGNVETGIIMIGEAPGKDEVKLGRPFVGLAGGKLKNFIEYLGLKREDIYVTNAIKYRLYKVNSYSGKKSNRPAKSHEIKASAGYLREEIEILCPKLVITLGNVPLKAVISELKPVIGDFHGKIITYGGFNFFPLYHPASLIYNRSLEEAYYKDLDKLKEVIGGLIDDSFYNHRN